MAADGDHRQPVLAVSNVCLSSCHVVPYFERVAVGVEHVHGDLDVLLHALAPPLEFAPLQGEVQVIADVSWDKHWREARMNPSLTENLKQGTTSLSCKIASLPPVCPAAGYDQTRLEQNIVEPSKLSRPRLKTIPYWNDVRHSMVPCSDTLCRTELTVQ